MGIDHQIDMENLKVVSKDDTGEEQDLSNGNVMCRMCFVGENEGSEKARKMLSCKSCGKKYHRNCLETWSQHRDLFHWSSWTCPSCRTCESHSLKLYINCICYCRGLCSAKDVTVLITVTTNIRLTRWFLGYTCCDACGILFVKGNYCPVCLKVYKDSESTPMVCCDNCQRWVHCHCDGINFITAPYPNKK